MRHARRQQGGQASLELIAAVPVIVVAVMVVLQLAALTRGAILAREDARAKALHAVGPGVVTVVGQRRVGSVIPGLRPFTIRVRARGIGR